MSTTFRLILELALHPRRRGLPADCLEFAAGGWWIALNAGPREREALSGDAVPPGCALAFNRGRLICGVALVTPREGLRATDAGDDLTEALRAELATANNTQEE